MARRMLIVLAITVVVAIAGAFVVRTLPSANLDAPFIVVVLGIWIFIGPLALVVTYLLMDRARMADRGDVGVGDPALARTGQKAMAEARFMTRPMDASGRNHLRHILIVALQARDAALGEVSKTWSHKIYGSGPMPETAVRVPIYFDPAAPGDFHVAWSEVEPAAQDEAELRAIGAAVGGINFQRFPEEIETAYLRAAAKARG